MARFDGQFRTYIAPDRTVALPPAWWLALIAGDPRDQIETSTLCFVDPDDASMTVTTCDRLDAVRRRLDKMQAARGDASGEPSIYDQLCALCLTDAGHLPLPRAVAGKIGDAVVLDGIGHSFRIGRAED